ncbi:CDP-alcohol phosphatidyltransferase family protein [Enterobacteriaceae bacterium 4M9]|nr:CDP-alcohol phosphatidyltransferase family protein [Enterobacteriaceae bacterium 4M9]
MTLYDIKPRFQACLRPLLVWLHRRNVSANQITLAALFLSLLTGLCLTYFSEPHLFILLPIILFIRMALNALDGMMAREYQQQSRLGALLNELGDVISDAALYLPLALLPGSNAALVVLMVLAAALTEFCGVLAQTLGQPRGYAGPMGKSDRALVVGTCGLLVALWPALCSWLNVVWLVMLALLVLTVVNRCRQALKAGEQ